MSFHCPFFSLSLFILISIDIISLFIFQFYELEIECDLHKLVTAVTSRTMIWQWLIVLEKKKISRTFVQFYICFVAIFRLNLMQRPAVDMAPLFIFLIRVEI